MLNVVLTEEKHFESAVRSNTFYVSVQFRFAIGLIYFGESLAASNLAGNEYRDFVLLAVVDIPAAIVAIVCAMR